ncbi:hypothetical protein LL936_04415 [Levilactobacillus brevis]|jgi:hypothetical protein|uniref:hypothetical protein n=2 Tax=Levilactobacillus brevis TaxID=1580 RepID=UPI0005507C22|nr:hypothetical protein [Levilactobacillus brevis]MBL3536492.1 hypothetical protein [Lactobacillus sp. GPR40-2]MBL3629367.1 hypothetical protein [Lactobacillus sp. GPB7-4]ARQ92520.1 hypothetical protein A6F60_01880 [Levilactobacillus brevis]KWU39415.1 hypothetical protein AV935_11120 [Levilactobacillus brevis]MBU5275192.1 hypothetical protein [Levilactobacillus brevis]
MMVECSLLQFEKVNLGKELFATSLVATVVFRKSIVNQHKPFIFSEKTDDDMPIEYYSRYTVGGQAFSTLIGSVHD